MLRHVAAFEFRYQLRSPAFWISCLLFFLMTFGSVTIDTIQIGARGNVNVNSPFAILNTLATMSVFAVFIVVAMVANVVLRDEETGFAPILRSTRLTKFDYLVGRYLGAVAAALIVYAMMPLAIAIGSLMPWLDPEKIGPFHLAHYLYATFGFALPTLLVTSAIFFGLATATRSMMWSYVGAVVMLVLYALMLGLLRDPRHDAVVALADPFGLSTFMLATKYWTATERNTLMPALEGVLLANRLLWAGVGIVVFAIAYAVYRPEGRRPRAGATAGAPAADADEARPARVDVASALRALPAPRADRATRLRQLGALARVDVGHVVRSPAFFVLLAIGAFNAGISLWYSGDFYGTPSYPVTRQMVEALLGSFSIIPMIIAVYYGGEIVWRDRDRRMHEIVDATAAPDWAHLLPKFLALVIVLVAVALVAVLMGVVVQLVKGYTHLEPLGYVLWFALPTAITAIQLAVLSVFVQVLVPQKFIGWAVMLLFVVAQTAAFGAGFEHSLYNYADTPPVPLSDMNGMGRFWIARAWFQAYWSAIALVLTVGAYALWRRGTTTALRPRLAAMRWRLHGPALAVLVIGVAGAIGTGAWCWHNTNVLNEYLPAPARDARLADFERTLLPFESTPQPRIAEVTLAVELEPRAARAVTHGRYVLENRTGVAIPAIHLRWDPRTRLDRVELTGATLERDWPVYHYAIYRLATPMQPGERRTLGFATTLEERGFPNRAPLTRIVANGTFVNNDEIAPRIGMSREALLTDRSKRRREGLPPDLRPAKLEDDAARATNMLRGDSDWVTADITVTTDADQTPIAPGYTVSDTVRDGRRTVRFRTDAPINHFFSIQSARYAVKRDRWRDVELAIYYHPGHEYNLQPMLAAMKTSLDVFASAFSPYQFRQARILEFPGYENFAQSFANTIPYSESLGFIANHTDPTTIDMVTYVTAHELGHQWWGHQLISANQQGATLLVESFAQYSALLVMERTYGRDQVRKFLKYELDRYLRRRGSEAVEELPLARVENQPYIHYQKGALAMYWLKEAVGEDVVDRSLRRLLARYAFKPAPYANPRDFLAILREEAGPAHEALIADLFEKITLLDLRARAPVVNKRADGRYDVEFTVDARKLYADGQGRETEAPLAEQVEIGAFAAKPGEREFTAGSVLALQRVALRSGTQTVRLVTASAPTWVGVDPYNKRIDRNSDDNLTAMP